MKAEYENRGFYLMAKVLAGSEVDSLINELSAFEGRTNNHGVRDLMSKVPSVRRLADSVPLMAIAKEILGDNAKPVRSVFFDKVPTANWNVAWHQDTSIAVKTKHKVAGFGPWSEKQGIVHVEPPVAYLANILTLRLHLDTANKASGVLRVVAGTHRNGRVAAKDIIEIVGNSHIVECNANRGDVLLMNPLLFHSSRKAVSPSHRRVVHLEYSAMALPEPLAWYE